ncbi:MAG: hypothetical protein ACD_28C00337G0007 [uncultured bacterium]|nr:MAG: hypothetical protein ACD_28C00337G0007 [uncultured bacterium]
MQLSHDEVRHVAKLARLSLTDREVDLFSVQLSNILSYVDVLKEVDTDQVLPTAQVTGLALRARADEVQPYCSDPKALLACSPLPIQSDQIRVKSVF